MKIKLPTFIKKINCLKILPFLLSALAIITVLFFLNFLYKNYFQLNKVIKKIDQLSGEVTPVVVDIKTYNLILDNLKNKQQKTLTDLSELKNPFKNIMNEKI